MKQISRTLLIAALTGLMSVPAMAAQEEGVRTEDMVVDVLIARPVGVVATVLGTAAFVVSLPFSAIGGNVDQAADMLVVRPAKETFVRCLGCRSSRQFKRGSSTR